MTNKEKEALQNFINAAWPFVLKAMDTDKHTVLCGRYPDHVSLTEAGDGLTVGDLRKLRDVYLNNIAVFNMRDNDD